MAFEQTTITEGVTQWADMAAATAWACEAQRLTRPSALAALDGAAWRDQEAAVRNGLQALSNMYRDLTLPATSDPVYATELRNMFASEAAILRVSRAPTAGAPFNASDVPAARRVATTTDGPVFAWSQLDAQSQPIAFCTRFASMGITASQAQRACEVARWDIATPVPVYGVVAPARWTAEMVHRVASQCLARGMRGVLEQSAAYVAGRNLALAQALNVDGTAALLDAIAAYNGRRLPNPGAIGIATGLGVAAAAANAIPVIGNVASVIIGVGAAITALFSARGLTRFEGLEFASMHVENGGGPTSQPTYADIPAPPAGSCVPDMVPGPRVISRTDPDGTLRVSVTDLPAGAEGAHFDVFSLGGLPVGVEPDAGYLTDWRFERQAGAGADSAVAGRETVLAAGPLTEKFLLRATVDVTPPGQPTYKLITPLVPSAYLAAALPDPVDILAAVGVDCARWSALSRADQLGRITRAQGLRDLPEGASPESLRNALVGYCLAEIAAGRVVITPPLVTPGRTVSPITPGGVDVANYLRVSGVTCAAWRGMDMNAKQEVFIRGGMPKDAEMDAAVAIADALCPPATTTDPSTLDHPALLAAMGTDCDGWLHMTVSQRESALARVGVTPATMSIRRDAVTAHCADAGAVAGPGMLEKVATAAGLVASAVGIYAGYRAWSASQKASRARAAT